MSDKSEVDLFSRIGRAILGRGLDIIIYTMLGLSFKIFFNIASAELFTNETIKNFVGRVQLVIGVFMMFKLAVAIVKGIIDPDSFMDKKGGVGNLVTRVIFALVMLTLVVPINIPGARNEYEVQLNNNGLLFGTLYSLQNRVLSNNTLGHLILGTTNNNYSFTTENGEAKLEEMSNMITSTVLKAFVKINVKDESQPETDSSNWLCEDLDSSLISTYTNPKSTTSEILDLTKETCDNNILPGTGEVYAFSYLYFASGIAGVIFVVLMVGFSIDVAKRAIKLAVLRLIAPIPIISYIDPSTQKKSFDSWVSAVISTYIDLFVRLALVYFVIFLISDIVANGLVISEATGMVGGLTVVFIFIGLFYFAKEAPKFFMDLFGIKGGGSGKIFDGFGTILGLGATAAGALGSAATGYRAASGEYKALHPTHGRIRNIGAGLVGAATGATTGLFAGGTAALTAKDHHAAAAMKAIQQKNATRAAHSTAFGRFQDQAYSVVTGKSLSARDQAVIDDNKNAVSALKNWKKMISDEAGKSGSHFGTATINGQQRQFNFEKLKAAQAGAQNGIFTYDGNQYNIADFDTNTMSKIQDSQAQNYYLDWRAGTIQNQKMDTEWQTTSKAVHDAGMDKAEKYTDPNGIEFNYTAYNGDYDSIGKQIGRGNKKQADMQTNMRSIKHRANAQSNKK